LISFATEFPVSYAHPLTSFLHAIRDWILGSPHTVLSHKDFFGIEAPGEWTTQRANERVEILSLSSPSQDWAAARYTKTDAELEWVTTIVFSRLATDSWVAVRVACESSHPAVRLPPAKKPIVVRTLLQNLGGASDGSLLVSSTPHRLENVDIDIAARLISGSAGCRLPIVFVSSGFHGDYIVDSDRLANDLSGMAHVVVEPNRAFSLRLKFEVDSENVYGGAIGVYWPDGAGRRSFFIGREYESLTEVQRAVVEEVRSALANRRPLDRCTWAAVQALVSHSAFEALKAAGSQEVGKYVEEFDKELRAHEEKLEDAEREIARLRVEVRKYESRTPIGSGLALRTGEEQDLYPGELAGIVLDAIQDASTRVVQGGRRAHVLLEILAVNDASGEAEHMREELKEFLRGFKHMGTKVRRGLERMGFTISEEGKHYKLVFQGDDRYTFALPKSGSDQRGGLNAASDIARLLL
jgi:HPt (histidine-containing phosphotransfer) domain-containing protein